MQPMHLPQYKHLVAIGAMSLFASLPVVALTMSPSWAAGCGVFAQTPSVNASTIGARGGRSGCASEVTLYVRLKWDRPLSPDPTLDSRSGKYTNVSLIVDAGCLAGTHDYYIATTTSSNQSTSSDPRRKANCF
jgi:hypothetical protein